MPFTCFEMMVHRIFDILLLNKIPIFLYGGKWEHLQRNNKKWEGQFGYLES